MTTIRINKEMKIYLDSIYESNETIKKENDDIFSKDTLPEFNNRVKSENYYGIDEYGLIIRKKDFNDLKSPFGWIKADKGKIINIHFTINKEKTLVYLRSKFASIFRQEKSILNRYYNGACTIEEKH